MKKRISIIYYGFIILIFIFYCIAGTFSFNKETTSWENSDELSEMSCDSVEQVSADTYVYRLDGSQVGTERCLAFMTNHQFIRVFADEELIYGVEKKEVLFGGTTGTRWNFASIPEGCEQITVELTAAYEVARDFEPVFYVGNGAQIYYILMRRSLAAMRVSLLNAAVGIIMILYWLVIQRKTTVGKVPLYFGTFALLMGLWSYGETDGAVLLHTNHVTASAWAFVCLMFMTIPFTLFVRESMRLKDRFFWKAICIYSFFETGLSFVLMLTGIRDFKESVLLTHIALALALLYLFYGLFEKIRLRELDKRVLVNMAGVTVMAVAFIADFAAYYSGAKYVDALGRIGFFIYIVMLAAQTTAESMEQIDAGRKASYYKEMASIDRLTGLYNRNAFIEDVEDMKNDADVAIVTFDLNDLKKTNDRNGHAAGDKYIIDAADAISHIFSPYGKCYRIGGDEFCTIIRKSSQCNIEKMMKKLTDREEEYNRTSLDVVMRIACGYANFDSAMDFSLNETRSRADARMYENKAEIKRKLAEGKK